MATRALADEVALLKAILLAEGRWVFQEEVRFHPSRRWRFDWASWELMLAVEWEGGTIASGRPRHEYRRGRTVCHVGHRAHPRRGRGRPALLGIGALAGRALPFAAGGLADATARRHRPLPLVPAPGAAVGGFVPPLLGALRPLPRQWSRVDRLRPHAFGPHGAHLPGLPWQRAQAVGGVMATERASVASRLPRSVVRDLTPSEAQFERWVISLARSLGYLAYHTHMSRHSEAGFPDLALLRERDGRLVLAELKVGDGVLRPMQRRWLAAAAHNPALEWYVWRYVWPGEVMQEIAEVLAR